MDSLLANYASSDDDADADETLTAPAPAASRLGEASAKPPAPSGGIFSSLPQAKSASLFSSIPAPKSAPLFSLPAAKSAPIFSVIPSAKSSSSASSASSGNPKRIVQFRPPPIRQPTGDSSDEEEDAEMRRPSASEARPPVPAGSGPVSSILPPPKHSVGLGSGAAGARRSAIDTAAPERSNLGAAGPSSSAVRAGAPERPNNGSADEDDSEESGDEEDMPAQEQDEQQEQQGFDAGTGQQQQQGYDAGIGSTNGHGGCAWDPNYYANYGASYGWDPSGNVNYGTGAQYAAYGGEQGGGNGITYGGEHGDGGHSAAVPYGGDYTGGYGHEAAAMTAPPIQEVVLPPEMGRIGRKRGRNDMPTEILEVNQAELMNNRPREDKSKLTGMAFGPSYQPAPSAKGKPTKLHKRKHQIGSLFHDMKQKEMELAERRSKGFLTKAETQAKYGW